MHQLCEVEVPVGAAPERVFASFERCLATAGLNDGDSRLGFLEHDPPRRLVWERGERGQVLRLTLTLREGAASRPGTAMRCELELLTGAVWRRALARLFAPVVRKRLFDLAQRVRAMAEGDLAPTAVALPGGGWWRRASNLYRGLGESCAPGLHAAAARLVALHLGPPQGEVLDLGAGSGAWLARLRDAGYTRFSAVELYADGFGLSGVVPWRIDLNQPFALDIGRRFRLVSALEIVEHLDSPRSFLRELHRLLADDGFAVVSMPNIACWQGRLRFLRRGEHRCFEEGDYAQRHISPMTDLHMRLMFREIGLRPLAMVTAGSFDGPLRTALLALVSALARALLGSRAVGDVAVYLLQRTEPDLGALGAESDYLGALNRRAGRA